MYCIFACSCECAIGARVRLWPATHTKHQRIGHYSFCVRHLYTQFCYCCCSYLLFIRFIYLFIYLLLWNWWLVIASIQMMIVGLLNLSRLFCCPFMFACACRCTLRSDSTRWWLILSTTNRPVANIQKIEVNLCEIECDRIWRIHIFSLYGHYWCALKCLLYFPIWWMKKKILIIERIHFYDVWLCQMQEERELTCAWSGISNRIESLFVTHALFASVYSEEMGQLIKVTEIRTVRTACGPKVSTGRPFVIRWKALKFSYLRLLYKHSK